MSAKTKTTPKQAAAEPAASVTVRARQNLFEEGSVRLKGEQFQLSAARAAVLPELVEILTP